MKPRRQSFLITGLLLLAIVMMAFYGLRQQTIGSEVVPINRVATQLNDGKISKLEADGDTLYITYDDPKKSFKSTLDPKMGLFDQLTQLGVTEEALQNPALEIRVRLPGFWSEFFLVAVQFIPFILMGVLFWIFIRQAQGSNNAAMQFGKSRARMLSGEQSNVTFADVAGVDEAKEELQEVVEFLKEPQKFMALGARIPKGVLLVGPPGTGKTLMAKAVSGEAGVPFFSISGSEFVEMFVGVGASRVRDLFDEAKKRSPCIVFVDEIDAVGRQRGAGLGGSHDEREQTLNQLLVEMDGFGTDTNVIVMAATNRPDILDPALLRPGRFDRRVMLDKPDMKGREDILKVHSRGKPISNDVDLGVLARGTPGFAGADLENLVNEAALLAARRDKKVIGNDEFEEAIERVIAGPERKSRLMNQEEKRLTAYHEAGHAIVITALPEGDPIQKVSIISRGMMGGFTLALPVEELNYKSKKMILADITGLLGGRAAEELMANDITSGASNDIERVTKLARAMVTRLGMSEEMGPMVYGQKEELVFLGREISEQRDYSEAVAERIDAEVARIVNDCYQHALDILTEHKAKLIEVAEKLLEQETLSKEEFDAIFPSPNEKTYGVPVIVTD